MKIGQRWIRLGGYNNVVEIFSTAEKPVYSEEPVEGTGVWLITTEKTDNGKIAVGKITSIHSFPAMQNGKYINNNTWKLLEGQDAV